MSCSIELAVVDDPCKSWYTLCRTATETFITASNSSGIRSGYKGNIRHKLTILLVVLLRDEINGILDILVWDLMLVQGAL